MFQVIAPENNSVRVSVIIPAYNAADYIKGAVYSALRQTEKSIEIIIVDDASTDNTWEVISGLAYKYPQIRAFRLVENRAKPYAMNYATERANGKWIAVLDADDWFAPDRLKRLIDLAEAEKSDIVADNLNLIDIQAQAFVGTVMPKRGKTFKINLDKHLKKSDPTVAFDYGLLKPVVKLEFMQKHNIQYYEPAKNGHDFYFLLSCFATGASAVVTDEPLYYYVQPHGSISNAPSHARRSRYRYEIMQATHKHFTEMLRPQLSRVNLWRMHTRSQKFKVIVTLHHIREAAGNKRYRDVAKFVCMAPVAFWSFTIKRTMSRFARKAKNAFVHVRKSDSRREYYTPATTDA